MRFVPTDIEGVYLLELEPFVDERGLFARVWAQEELAAHGLTATLSQCSISRNTKAGTLRGMHFQHPPHAEAKLVRCTSGAIYDVALDLRDGSPTFGRWFGAELSAANGAALFIPEGCAHGFQTLTDDSEVLYMISAPYAPDAAGGVRFDDEAFGIEWPPCETRTINERDRNYPDYASGSLVSRGT